MPSHSFLVSERLKSRKIISTLFQKDKAKSFGSYPIRIIWIEHTIEASPHSIQAAFTVPKKNFRRANERNVIRRRVREAYRLHKHLLYDAIGDTKRQFALMWLYTGKEEMSYQEIEKSMIAAIRRFIREIEPK